MKLWSLFIKILVGSYILETVIEARYINIDLQNHTPEIQIIRLDYILVVNYLINFWSLVRFWYAIEILTIPQFSKSHYSYIIILYFVIIAISKNFGSKTIWYLIIYVACILIWIGYIFYKLLLYDLKSLCQVDSRSCYRFSLSIILNHFFFWYNMWYLFIGLIKIRNKHDLRNAVMLCFIYIRNARCTWLVNERFWIIIIICDIIYGLSYF